MTEIGHKYTFGHSSAGQCRRCGSKDHWTLHCPGKFESKCGSDTCPCQDGDVCHYEYCPETGTPAMPKEEQRNEQRNV